MDLSRNEVFSIIGIAISAISTVATIARPRGKSRKFLLFIFGTLLVLSILWLLREMIIKNEGTLPVKFAHFENGKKLYNAQQYRAAITEFEESYKNELSEMPQSRSVEVKYYLGSSHLRLSTPDCGEVIRLIPQMYPDPDGLANQLLNECKQVGCNDCGTIKSWSN